MARSATPRLVNALRVGYYAFLGLGCGGILVVVGVILRAVLALHRWGMAGLAGGLIVLLVLVALVLVAAVWQVLRAVVVAAREKPGWIPPSSIPLNREEQGTMYAWIEALAQAGGLLPPDRIWLAAESGAYVYESDHGRELVLGGGLVAVLGRSALEGVVAHELAHFSAGDTRLVRETQDLRQLMAEVASRLSVRGWSGYNPFAWALRAYHYVYALAWASHSRERERAADLLSVDLSGREATSSALVILHAVDHLPWARLRSVVEGSVRTGASTDTMFAEYRRRVEETRRTGSGWMRAVDKALSLETNRFDHHPCLRERLQAIRVDPAHAREIRFDPSDTQASLLVSGWETIERKLTRDQIAEALEELAAKRDIASIILGRPVGRQ